MRELRTAQQETDRQLRLTQRETNKQIKELTTQIGGLGNKFGRFAEGLAFPSLEKFYVNTFVWKHCRYG